MASKFEELARSLTAEGENQKLPGLAVMVADDSGMLSPLSSVYLENG